MELCGIDWLPTPEVVMARSKAAAAADLLLSPDPDFRQYHCKVGADGSTVASREAGGSYYYVLQSGDTTAIKVCAMRLSLGPDALARFQKNPTVEMPPVATRLLNGPEFRYQELSFFAWTQGGGPWQGLLFRVDGKTSLELGKPLLELLCLGPRVFYVHAQTYHEVTIDPTALKALFALTPLDQALASKIAPAANLGAGDLRQELKAIGYPLA